jgi:hypothetical protein
MSAGGTLAGTLRVRFVTCEKAEVRMQNAEVAMAVKRMILMDVFILCFGSG